MKVPYQIRIEPELLDLVKRVAKKNGTSVNHEIRQAVRKMLNDIYGDIYGEMERR